jgi:hypothetical protein
VPTTLSLAASANPATVGAAVSFTATVRGPDGAVPDGTVQFTVDGTALGGPVPLAGGTATSSPAPALSTGAHQVGASYSGSAAFLAGDASLTQLVRYAITVLSPANGARAPAGTIVPIRFQVTDANGRPIPLWESLALTLRPLRVSVSGAQSLRSNPVIYNPFGREFVLPWLTARRPAGPVTVTISITYPDAPTQRVTTTFTLA